MGTLRETNTISFAIALGLILVISNRAQVQAKNKIDLENQLKGHTFTYKDAVTG